MARTPIMLMLLSMVVLVACEADIESGTQTNAAPTAGPTAGPLALDLTGPSWTAETPIMQNDIGGGISFELTSPDGHVLKAGHERMTYGSGTSTFRFFANNTATYAQAQKAQKTVELERDMLVMTSYLEFVSETQASLQWQLEGDRLFLTVQDVRSSWSPDVGLATQDGDVRPFGDALRELGWDAAPEDAETTQQTFVSKLNDVPVGIGFPKGTTLEFEVEQLNESEIRLSVIGDDGEPGGSITLAR